LSLLRPGDVQSAFNELGIPSRFGRAEMARLDTTTPTERPGYVVFPTPEDNQALSVLALRKQLGVDPAAPPAFFDHPWYLDEPFGDRPCDTGWHVIRMGPLDDSVERPVYYAEEIRENGQFLPWSSEVLLMLFLHFAATGERLLERKHTWTRDRTERTAARRFVSIGAFGKKGVFVSSHEVGYKSRGLGICPAIVPPSRTE